jgi:hypothetical protein
MMIVGNAARTHGIAFSDPAQMANDLYSISGEVVRGAILLLMMNAAVLGTTAISLSSAWAYGEVKGWPHSLEMPLRTWNQDNRSCQGHANDERESCN